METKKAILVLGGSTAKMERESFAAFLALSNTNSIILISSGREPSAVYPIFLIAGVDFQRVVLDYQAVDTITNFTTSVAFFKAHGIKQVSIVTSDYHSSRAKAIARIIFGFYNIDFKFISLKSCQPPEPLYKTIRDVLRAIVWIVTGYTGVEFLNLKRLWMRA